MDLTLDAILKLVLLVKDQCESIEQLENDKIAAALCTQIRGLACDEEGLIRRMFEDGLSMRAAARLIGIGFLYAEATHKKAVKRLGRLIQEELK